MKEMTVQQFYDFVKETLEKNPSSANATVKVEKKDGKYYAEIDASVRNF